MLNQNLFSLNNFASYVSNEYSYSMMVDLALHLLPTIFIYGLKHRLIIKTCEHHYLISFFSFLNLASLSYKTYLNMRRLWCQLK